MLDPRFGYATALPAGARERYRVAWKVSVDGRLVRTGRLPGTARVARWEEFRNAFPTLGAAAADVFARLFDDPAPTHAGLVAIATSPRRGVERACARAVGGLRDGG